VAVVLVLVLIVGTGSGAGTSGCLAPVVVPSASALAGEAGGAGLGAKAEAAYPGTGPETGPVEYWQTTARLSQFSHGCCELQAFFWRTQRSQARRRPEAGAGMPSHDCR
jgi:hypothetical protein